MNKDILICLFCLYNIFSVRFNFSSIVVDECQEEYMFLGESCLSMTSLVDNVDIYKAVSPDGCRHLCTKVYSETCSLIMYDHVTQTCYLTQPSAINVTSNGETCHNVDVYRKVRCLGEYNVQFRCW